MKQFIQAVTLFSSLLFIATVSEADELGGVLAEQFAPLPEADYLSYERVERSDADEYGAMRYLVMDFAPAQGGALQHKVHAICTRVLNDDSLLRRLSNEGFDMVSVSFDRHTQFDCL